MRLFLLTVLAACVAPADGQLLSSTAYMEVEGAVVYDVTYLSGGLVIRGMVAVPEGEGPHPLVWWNHGGFKGMGYPEVEGLGRRAAQTGAVVAASMYRGEGGSEGEVEYCLGEVDDVWALRLATEQLVPLSGVAAAIGSSHGACISLWVNARAAEAGEPLLATVTMGTPSDVDVLLDWHYAEGDPHHAAIWEPYLRGAENRDMSPRYAPVAPPVVMLHGMDDRIVPVEQGCLMRDAVAPPWPAKSYRLDVDQQPVVPGDVKDCLGQVDAGDPWTTLPDGVRLISLEGVPHGPPSWVRDRAWEEVQAHLMNAAHVSSE